MKHLGYKKGTKVKETGDGKTQMSMAAKHDFKENQIAWPFHDFSRIFGNFNTF